MTPAPTQPAPPPTTPTSTPAPVNRAFEINARLGRGVNLGNALEAPVEGQWGMVIRDEYFQLIKEAGFNSIRLPIRWNAHALVDAPYTIDPAFFERIDHLVDLALAQELLIILDLHHYNELQEDPKGQRERFLSITDQVARHYQDFPESVLLEVLNEPHDAFGRQHWNDYAAEAVAVIRQSNPDRVLILGGGDWNSHTSLRTLKLPEDARNIIATFHYYLPFHFTHQGAEWAEGSQAWLGRTWDGTPQEQSEVRSHFNQVKQWADSHNVPVFMGEFGAYSKADMDSRVRWTTFVAREAEACNFSWAYWEFGAGFGVYDRKNAKWNEGLLSALIPPQ